VSETKKTEYTYGEIKALLAPIFDISTEDITSFVIIIEGKCCDCGGPNGIIELDNITDHVQLGRVLSAGFSASTERDDGA